MHDSVEHQAESFWPVGAAEPGAGAQIDALCGIIVAITLISAYTARYDQMIGHTKPLLASANLGFLSLQMFFAVLAYQTLKEISQHRGWLAYAADRLRRFLPVVMPAVALSYVIVAGCGVPHLHADVATLLANLTMLADFIGARDFDGAFWRLKIEIMFSAGLGLVWFGMGGRAAMAVMLACLAVCLARAHPDPVHQTVLTSMGVLTMDGYLPNLAFGTALFFLSRRSHRALWLAVAALCGVLVVASNSAWHAVLVLFAYLVIGGATQGIVPSFARLPPLNALGRMFFAVYLVHQAVGFALIHALEQQGIAPCIAIGVAVAAAILCAAGIHRVATTLRTGGWRRVTGMGLPRASCGQGQAV